MSPSAGSDMWIGLTAMIGEGHFRWLNSSVLTWSDWNDYSTIMTYNQPDGGHSELCVVYRWDSTLPGGMWVWEDRACTKEYGYLCQSQPGMHAHLHVQNNLY